MLLILTDYTVLKYLEITVVSMISHLAVNEHLPVTGPVLATFHICFSNHHFSLGIVSVISTAELENLRLREEG